MNVFKIAKKLCVCHGLCALLRRCHMMEPSAIGLRRTCPNESMDLGLAFTDRCGRRRRPWVHAEKVSTDGLLA